MENLQPHQQRVVEEREELLLKYNKLQNFINSEKFSELDEDDKKLLKYQLYTMSQYLRILDLRIYKFDNCISESSEGEKIIGFFGTEKDEVSAIKYGSIFLIDTIEALVDDPRRKAIAKTHIEQAQMMAVKGLFSK